MDYILLEERNLSFCKIMNMRRTILAALAKAWPDFIPQDLPSIDWLFRAKTVITADAASASKNWKSPL